VVIHEILEDSGGGEGVNALAFLHAGEVAGEFGFGVVGGEVFGEAVEGEGGAEELLEGDDEAFGEHGLLGGVAVGVEGEADDDGVDGFAFDEFGDGLGELLVGEVFEHFEGEGEAAVGGAGFADGEAGALVAEVDAEETHGGIKHEGHDGTKGPRRFCLVAAEAGEHFVDGFSCEGFGGEGFVALLGVGLFEGLLPHLAEGVVGAWGEVELVAEGGFPVGAAKGFADHGVEFGGAGGVEFADGVEDVVFENRKHGVLFVAVGDGVVEHAHCLLCLFYHLVCGAGESSPLAFADRCP
jgi:hypothetical protein